MENAIQQCQKCGKEYKLNKQYSKAQIARSKFCSRECQYTGKVAKGGGSNKGKKMPWKLDKVSPLQEQIRKCFEYRQWRSDIYTRDNWSCVECGSRGVKLNADHFPVSFRELFYQSGVKTLQEATDFGKFWDINNGRTLCEICHKKTSNFGSKAKIYG